MVLCLHFARNQAFLVTGVEMRNHASAGLSGNQVGPSGFNICTQGRNQT
jgi:hypothetical protein